MPALLLTEKEVEGLLRMDDALWPSRKDCGPWGEARQPTAHGSESEPERPPLT